MSAIKIRSYEKNFDVAAPVESVWKEITDGDELSAGFVWQQAASRVLAASSTSTRAVVQRQLR